MWFESLRGVWDGSLQHGWTWRLRWGCWLLTHCCLFVPRDEAGSWKGFRMSSLNSSVWSWAWYHGFCVKGLFVFWLADITESLGLPLIMIGRSEAAGIINYLICIAIYPFPSWIKIFTSAKAASFTDTKGFIPSFLCACVCACARVCFFPHFYVALIQWLLEAHWRAKAVRCTKKA